MPFTYKKGYSEIKCYFCGREKCKKIYTIEFYGQKKIICSECKYLHNTIQSQYEANRGKSFQRIHSSIKNKDRHCMLCKWFIKDSPKNCRKGYNTGVGGRHEENYPYSYANHGCNEFRRKL